MDAPVIIVGAGLAGLTTAYELRKAGVDALVLEARPTIGGRVERTTDVDGIADEALGQEYSELGPAHPLLRELGVPLAESVARSTVIIDGTLLSVGEDRRGASPAGTFRAAEREVFLHWNETTRGLAERLRGAGLDGRPLPTDLRPLLSMSFMEYLRRQRLPHRVEEWIRVTLESSLGTGWDGVAALDGVDEIRALLEARDGLGERTFRVEGGTPRFVKALAGALAHDAIRTTMTVTRIVGRTDGVSVHCIDGAGTERCLDGRYAVVTTSLFDLDRMEFEPPLSAERSRAFDTMRFGSRVTVLFRVRPEVARTWERRDGHRSTLLSDGPSGTIHASGSDERRDPVLIASIRGRFAKDLLSRTDREIAQGTAANIEGIVVADHEAGHQIPLFAGFSSQVISAAVFKDPMAGAYWPHEFRRSRFDDLARESRRPHGRVFIGGETTENGRSEGGVSAALRMAADMLVRLERQQVRRPETSYVV